MSHRPGRNWRVTIVDDPDPQPCDEIGPHYCFALGENSEHHTAKLHAVVMAGKVLTTDPELAERVCELLNDEAHTPDVSWTRGAAEALAEVRRLLEHAAGPDEEIAAGTVRHALQAAAASLGVDEDTPRGPLSSTQTAQTPSVGGNGRPGGAETISGGCDCGHDGLDPMFHLRPCPIAERRVAEAAARLRSLFSQRETERTADCSLHTGWADKDGGWIDCSPGCAGNQRKADQT